MRLRVKLALHLARFQSYELLKRSDTERGPINPNSRSCKVPITQAVSQLISHHHAISQPPHISSLHPSPPHIPITQILTHHIIPSSPHSPITPIINHHHATPSPSLPVNEHTAAPHPSLPHSHPLTLSPIIPSSKLPCNFPSPRRPSQADPLAPAVCYQLNFEYQFNSVLPRHQSEFISVEEEFWRLPVGAGIYKVAIVSVSR